MDSKHFYYRNEKHILTYNLSFKKYYVGSNFSKLNSEPNNNTFQFYETKNIYIKNFTKINFKLFDIYKDEKHILV